MLIKVTEARASVAGIKATPELVNDPAAFAKFQQAQLENQLANLERDTGAQIAVLLLPTTQPESIEAFGIRLAEAWQIGRKGTDENLLDQHDGQVGELQDFLRHRAEQCAAQGA